MADGTVSQGLPEGYSIEGQDPQSAQTQAAPSGLPEGYQIEGQDTPAPTTGQSVKAGLGEAGGDVWDTIKSAVNPTNSNLLGSVKGAYQHIQEAVPLFHEYENARASGKGVMDSLSAANDKAKQIHEAQDTLKQRADEFKKNPTQAGTRALADAAALAASIWAGKAIMPEAGAAAASTEEPSLATQVMKGEGAAQPAAQSAVRSGAAAASDEAGLSGAQGASMRTLVEPHIDALESSAKSSYQQVDAAAGTDFKALNEKLANTRYQLRQLTETDADTIQEEKLKTSEIAIQNKIDAAKQTAIDKGVDPKLLDKADGQFRQAQALRDVETKVLKNPNIVQGNTKFGTGETVNIDQAVKALQKLSDAEPYGASRLEQALGKQGAQKLLQDMYAAQRTGVKAMAKQEFAIKLAKYVGLPVAGAVAGVAAVHH